MSVSAISDTKNDFVPTISNHNSENNIFEINFGRQVTKATALDLKNYKLDNTTLTSSMADIWFDSNQQDVVIIELKSKTINVGQVGR